MGIIRLLRVKVNGSTTVGSFTCFIKEEKVMRLRIKCINKVRDNRGNIIKYQLVAEDGSRIEATAEQIKQEMKHNNRYDFINLQIDSIGRLVHKKVIFKNKEEKKKRRIV